MTFDITMRSDKGVVDIHSITKRVPAVCACPAKPAHTIDWTRHEAGAAAMDALIAERRADAVLATGKPFAVVAEPERGEE